MSELTFPIARFSNLQVHSDPLSIPLISAYFVPRTTQRRADGEWVVRRLILNPENHVNPI
jgi:hypothetical protein